MPVILLLEDGDEWLNPDIRTGTIIIFVKTISGEYNVGGDTEKWLIRVNNYTKLGVTPYGNPG
jgi:hypothetical protein